MEPAHYKLHIYKGATFFKRFTYLSGALGSNPKDLSAYTGVWTIKDAPGGAVLATYTGSPNIIFGGLAGTIDLVIPAVNTGSITYTSGIFEFLITGSGRTDPLLFGPVVVQDI